MGKKTAEEKAPKWYEVVEPSYIGDRLYVTGERVQFDGEAGSNLRELSSDELKKAEPAPTDDDLLLDREQGVTKRENDVAQREQDAAAKEGELQLKEEDLQKQVDALDARSKELDEREAAIKAKEDAAK